MVVVAAIPSSQTWASRAAATTCWLGRDSRHSLSNNTTFLQVNYFKDHTKLIVGGERQWQVTYINSERQSRSWSLSDLTRRGASPPVRERLTYVASVMEEFAELDEQAST